jgi:hypothetical protein
MARFMDVHNGMKGITAAQLEEAHRKDLELEQGTGVHFEKAWADPASGKVFCLCSGPNKEAVADVHKRAGHPADEIYEVPLSVQ